MATESRAWVCPWGICNHEQAQMCRADTRKGCGHIPDRLHMLIDNLRGTQAAMRQSAALLKREGIADHAAEMEGAANIIDSWIHGIRNTKVAAMERTTQKDEDSAALRASSTAKETNHG